MRTQHHRHEFHKLDVGDSWLVTDAGELRSIKNVIAAMHRKGSKRFSLRQVEGGYRVTREE